jgi:hypothetical protein
MYMKMRNGLLIAAAVACSIATQPAWVKQHLALGGALENLLA